MSYPETRERRTDITGETVADLLAQVAEMGVDPALIRLGSDRQLEWESPQTPEEAKAYAEWQVKNREREAEAERRQKGLEAWIEIIGAIQDAARKIVAEEEKR